MQSQQPGSFIATRNMMGDLSAAIFQESEAIEVAGVLSHIEQEKMALTLTQMLLFQWEKFRTYENLEAALERGIQTTTMLSDSSPELAYLHTNIARLLLFRNNDRDDLDAALWYAEDALNRQSENDPQYAYFFYTIGEILIARYRRESDCDDLENAITRFLQTQTLMADDDPMQKKTHEALGINLSVSMESDASTQSKPLRRRRTCFLHTCTTIFSHGKRARLRRRDFTRRESNQKPV
ncbi:hypothetical protein F4861DRAFT_311865 [Xylaria intraflava]|nr:hypothetical protein F4861DRAFT_311865 [Xylaria intraflava]